VNDFNPWLMHLLSAVAVVCLIGAVLVMIGQFAAFVREVEADYRERQSDLQTHAVPYSGPVQVIEIKPSWLKMSSVLAVGALAYAAAKVASSVGHLWRWMAPEKVGMRRDDGMALKTGMNGNGQHPPTDLWSHVPESKTAAAVRRECIEIADLQARRMQPGRIVTYGMSRVEAHSWEKQ
jgi:hypothetical protein